MKILTVVLFGAAMMMVSGSCSEKSDSSKNTGLKDTTSEERESEQTENASQPDTDWIIGDCVGFVYATKAVSRSNKGGNCPQCPPNSDAKAALKFEGLHVDRISTSGLACEVAVTIRASFMPSEGGTIAGGLVGWIPAEQRTQYSNGKTPSGEQVYKVKITYHRRGTDWRAVEFDRASRD